MKVKNFQLSKKNLIQEIKEFGLQITFQSIREKKMTMKT